MRLDIDTRAPDFIALHIFRDEMESSYEALIRTKNILHVREHPDAGCLIFTNLQGKEPVVFHVANTLKSLSENLGVFKP